MLVLLHSLIVLIGWVFESPRLASSGFNVALPMSPTTAGVFMLLGAALIGLQSVQPAIRSAIVSGAGGIAILVGGFRLVDLLMGLNTHFDQWLLHDRLAERGLLGSIGVAPTTSIGFIAIGLGLILTMGRGARGPKIGQVALLLTLLLASIVAIGHLYQTLQFYQVGQLFPMAPATATNFLLTSIGMIALRPDIGFARILTAPNLGGVMARQLFPVIVLAPVLLGLLSLYLTRWRAIDPVGGIGTLVTATGVVLAAAVLITSHRLEKIGDMLVQRGQELEAARIEADNANRAKSEFLANMSHELRTPLNAIIGFSELMHDARFGPLAARYREYAGDIFHSGHHLLTVINQILDLAKIEANQLELDENWISLSDIALASLSIVQERALKGEILLQSDIPADFPPVFVDGMRLKQIILNLLSNAVKFTQPGGRIAISVRTDDRGLEIRVADTGIGMNAAEVSVAFTPFRQIDSSLSRRYDGTGLGLPLAKAMAEQHGGKLTLDSKPGVGTTAIIWLPDFRLDRTKMADPRDRTAASSAVS